MTIAAEMIGHFDQLYAEIEIAVKAFPDALWTRDDVEDLLCVPAVMAHHTVWCMSLDHLLNIPREDFTNTTYPPYDRSRLPTKEQVLEMLSGIKDYTTRVYSSMPDDEFLEKRDKPHVPLGAAAYALGHGRHHIGQLAQVLKENGVTPPAWYPIG